jgi:hypothetical protein
MEGSVPNKGKEEARPNIYMAFGCQEKNLSYRSERERAIIRPKVNEALTNDPMVPQVQRVVILLFSGLLDMPFQLIEDLVH